MRFGGSVKLTNLSQKKRTFKKILNFPNFFKGSAFFFFYNFIKFECVYLKFLKRKIKKLVKRKKKRYRGRRLWINLKANYPLTKKSKNSRMGKGKGIFLRWVVTIRPTTKFAEFLGYPFQFLVLLRKSLRCCYKSDIDFFHNLRKYPIWSNPKNCRHFNSVKRKKFF